jgi:hypothetical protein
MHIKAHLPNSITMYPQKPYNLVEFELRSSVPEADAMTTMPIRPGQDTFLQQKYHWSIKKELKVTPGEGSQGYKPKSWQKMSLLTQIPSDGPINRIWKQERQKKNRKISGTLDQ